MSSFLDRMTIPRRLLSDAGADRTMARLWELQAAKMVAPALAAYVEAAGQRYVELTAARNEARRLLAGPIDEQTSAKVKLLRDKLERRFAAWVAACKGLLDGQGPADIPAALELAAGHAARAPDKARVKTGAPKLRLRRRSPPSQISA
jgi:hypothetical protein